ncbi:16S rRNA methyltransferase [Clostridiales bacterium PH28_bin88]|nr:16S rRNA methyltransferase [Clostridiales bacterium PH28_bin88]
MDFHHVPVLLDETLAGLAIRPEGIYVDCTLGGGGHSLAIAQRLNPRGLLIGIDQDAEAIEAASKKLKQVESRVELVHANFGDLGNILRDLGVPLVDGCLFDLGVSSHQLDVAERGFSYMQEAPLDMRMDPARQQVTVQDLVNGLSQEELARILWEYGEERWAKRIASFIVERRRNEPFNSTGQLVDTIKAAIPAAARRTGPHPAKRSFQALRIAVNDELGNLARALRQAAEWLCPGGRVCVISFHSLEDRIVKQTFTELSGKCQCPPGLPACTCDQKAILRLVSRKPVVPTGEEIRRNPRARSAKLRVAERIHESEGVLNGKEVE